MLLPTPTSFLAAGWGYFAELWVLVNAVFMVLTPEPFALGMGTAAGSGPGGGEDSSAVLPKGPEHPPAGVISLTSGLLASFWSHGISRGSSVQSGS